VQRLGPVEKFVPPPPPPKPEVIVKAAPVVIKPKEIPLIQCRYCEICVPKPEIKEHEAKCFDNCRFCGERMLKKELPKHEAQCL
jgi:hypothetical protein